ncbi:SRPBCC family protein [Ornithinimicrobium sp. LYQ121]|uniref:SRPBCC family protein n=1 Tax=Ornithinimicrobium sp. LYQ121 TaxID=3378801 RepID=UPI003853E996
MEHHPHEVRLSRRIAAPPADVWQVLTDLDLATSRLSQVTELHQITGGPYAVGTRWRETRRMMGASDTQEIVVVENDPLRRTVTEAVDGATRYRTTILLESLDDAVATLVTVTFSAAVTDPSRLQRLALRVVAPLGLKLTEKSLRTELDDIARAAESLPH